MLALLALLAATGPPVGAPTHPVAAPRSGHAGTTFRVQLTSRVDLGRSGFLAQSYVLSAMAGPRHGGCVASVSASLDSGRAGQVLHADLKPVGGRWCTGRYRGRVALISGPYCPKRAAGVQQIPCPEFPTRMLSAGRFSFRVR